MPRSEAKHTFPNTPQWSQILIDCTKLINFTAILKSFRSQLCVIIRS